jgi:hypothetical protein
MIRNTPASATATELAVPPIISANLAAGQRRHIERVIADADARDNLERRCGVEFGLAERLERPARSRLPSFPHSIWPHYVILNFRIVADLASWRGISDRFDA